MKTAYDETDFEKVASGSVSADEMAKKYKVKLSTFKKAFQRRGYRVRKRIKIVSPYKTIYVSDIQKCAEELRLSRSTIVSALKGKRVPILDDLNIKIEREI